MPVRGAGKIMSDVVHIIDDDDAVRESLGVLLEVMGFVVFCHPSAEDYLTRGRPGGCIVLDVNMPGMSGMDLLRHLCARVPPVPVLVLTASREHLLEERVRALGAGAFLSKPVVASTLLDELRRLTAG